MQGGEHSDSMSLWSNVTPTADNADCNGQFLESVGGERHLSVMYGKGGCHSLSLAERKGVSLKALRKKVGVSLECWRREGRYVTLVLGKGGGDMSLKCWGRYIHRPDELLACASSPCMVRSEGSTSPFGSPPFKGAKPMRPFNGPPFPPAFSDAD